MTKDKINNKQKNIIYTDLEYTFRVLDTDLFKDKNGFITRRIFYQQSLKKIEIIYFYII